MDQHAPETGEKEGQSRQAERREHPRAALSSPSRWEFRLSSGFYDAVVMDVSEGGMFVASPSPPPQGSAIDFEVRFAGGMPVMNGRGEVVWTSEPARRPGGASGMGVRFVDLDDSGREVVRVTVEQRDEIPGSSGLVRQPRDLF